MQFIKSLKSSDQRAETEECSKLRRVMLDFTFMQLCDHMVVTHSGFGVFGGFLRRTAPEKEFYVYTSPHATSVQSYWNRTDMRFVKLDKASDLFFL